MICPRCHAENDDRLKFCEDCGAQLARACLNCGAQVRPGKKFCGECGWSTDAPPTQRFASPRQYTPQRLAEKILASKAALEGERKHVTVLFADLKGSMELLAERDPEEARSLLDPVIEKMMEAVHCYDGTVNQVMGDGLMALFGAPLALEDHAVRACYAALRMQEAIRGYAQEVFSTHGLAVEVRVGINSGEVVVGAVGSDLRMEYTAVGQTTHLAARMEQLARPGTTYLTRDTFHLAEGLIQVTPLGPVPVKGLPDPLEVFELTGASGARSRLRTATVFGLSKFVGRSAEMTQMSFALERARAGHGQVLALVGEPGVGKSRLTREFTHSDRTQGWLVFETGSMSYEKANTLRPVIELLKRYFQIEDRDDGQGIREKVTARLLGLDEALQPTLPALLGLLDVPFEGQPAWESLDPPQRRQRMLDACKVLVLRVSQVQPVVLVFEDLQWIDTESQAFLDTLIDALPTARLLLLVTFRPEYQNKWTAKTYYTQLGIDPLAGDIAETLLGSLLGDDLSLRPIKQLLIERTEGNPFFLEESIQTLLDSHALVGRRSAYRLTAPLASIQVPPTVQAVLAARIDKLRPEEKHLLQVAAVIGKDVPLALLQAVVELPGPTFRRSLAHLQSTEFLYESSSPDSTYTFKHALTHEVAYSGLLLEQRRAFHARILEAIERLYADRLVEHVERLGQHALRGGVWDKAVRYLRQAGAKAFARSANREAVIWLEQALAGLEHLAPCRETSEQAIDLRFELRTALFPLREVTRQLLSLREAQVLVEALGDQHRLGRLLGYLAQSLNLVGEYDKAIDASDRAYAIGDAIGDLGLKVVASFQRGQAFAYLGEHRHAIKCHRWIVESVSADLSGDRFGLQGAPAVMARAFLVRAMAELGHFDKGISWGNEAARLAGSIANPFSSALVCWNLGYAYLRKGDLQEATSVLEEGLKVATTGNPLLFPAITATLGYAYVLSARVQSAIGLLEDSSELSGSGEITFERSLHLMFLGEAYLAGNRMDDARDVARRALEHSRDKKERGYEAWCLRLVGEITAYHDVEDAGDSYQQSLSLAEQLYMRPLVAHCHLGLAGLYRTAKKWKEAGEHLSTAVAMYRDMNMRFWLEKAEPALESFDAQ